VSRWRLANAERSAAPRGSWDAPLAKVARRFSLAVSDPVLLAAQLTCATLLLAPIGSWLVRPFVLALAVAGLVAPGVAASALFWAALAALAALRVALDWPMSDNHGYLLAIWCSALAIACADARPRAVLARNARLLIGIAFALATLQKAFSPDYRDDTFFRWAFAVDARFEELSRVLGRGGEDLDRTRDWIAVAPGEAPPEGTAFVETPELRTAATVFTWATLLLEGAVALAFLAPRATSLARARDVALLLFCAGTYAIAPVAGFGWILLAMGAGQSESDRARWLYLAVFALLVFHREIPWLAFVPALVR
jgi:hypothetical protein